MLLENEKKKGFWDMSQVLRHAKAPLLPQPLYNHPFPCWRRTKDWQRTVLKGTFQAGTFKGFPPSDAAEERKWIAHSSQAHSHTDSRNITKQRDSLTDESFSQLRQQFTRYLSHLPTSHLPQAKCDSSQSLAFLIRKMGTIPPWPQWVSCEMMEDHRGF